MAKSKEVEFAGSLVRAALGKNVFMKREKDGMKESGVVTSDEFIAKNMGKRFDAKDLGAAAARGERKKREDARKIKGIDGLYGKSPDVKDVKTRKDDKNPEPEKEKEVSSKKTPGAGEPYEPYDSESYVSPKLSLKEYEKLYAGAKDNSAKSPEGNPDHDISELKINPIPLEKSSLEKKDEINKGQAFRNSLNYVVSLTEVLKAKIDKDFEKNNIQEEYEISPEEIEKTIKWEIFSEGDKEKIKEKIKETQKELDDYLASKKLEMEEKKKEKEKKKNEPEEELTKPSPFTEAAMQYTYSKIKKYEELNAENLEEGKEQLKKKMIECWTEFATHGSVVGFDEKGNAIFLEKSDCDGSVARKLFEMAGFDTSDMKFVKQGEDYPGRVCIDTGNKHGVIAEEREIIEKDGKKKIYTTLYLDHHHKDSDRESSSTKFTYELLREFGFLKKEEYLDNLVDFANRIDNKTYLHEIKFFKDYFEDSWEKLYGLQNFIGREYEIGGVKFGFTVEKLIQLFKDGKKPNEKLSKEEMENYGFAGSFEISDPDAKTEEFVKKNKSWITFSDGQDGKKIINYNFSERQKNLVHVSRKIINEFKKQEFFFETEDYGKVLVNVNRTIRAGYDAVYASGYNTYVIWNPDKNGFFVNSSNELKGDFKQGRNVRGRMWIKPRNEEKLNISLGDVLNVLTDGKVEFKGELEEYIEGEKEKIEEEQEDFEIFKEAGVVFWEYVENNTDWSNYDPEGKDSILSHMTKAYLREKSKEGKKEKINNIMEAVIEEIKNKK